VSNRLERVAKLEATDLYVNLELTHDCNLKCKTCHVGAGDFKPVHLAREHVPRILSSILSIRQQYRLGFTLTGGEPTLVPFLPEIVRALRREKGVTVLSMVTNGILVDESLLLSLEDAGLDWLAVSLDGDNR
jgi:MoaA/NifB/PqqE/SkfB family radical SAM enzyme